MKPFLYKEYCNHGARETVFKLVNPGGGYSQKIFLGHHIFYVATGEIQLRLCVYT